MLEVDVGLKNGGIDRAPRFDLDPSPSQRRHLSSNEAEYWEHHSPRSQEAREKQPSFTPTPTFELSSSNGDGLRLRATEPKRRRLTLRPPRPPPFPLNPNLAPAANYLKSRFGPNPFPYPDPEGAPIYFPASSGKLLAVKPRHFSIFVVCPVFLLSRVSA